MGKPKLSIKKAKENCRDDIFSPLFSFIILGNLDNFHSQGSKKVVLGALL